MFLCQYGLSSEVAVSSVFSAFLISELPNTLSLNPLLSLFTEFSCQSLIALDGS